MARTEAAEWNTADSPHGHVSVLLEEAVRALQPRSESWVAVDCTCNGGGHSEALLGLSSPGGRVIGLDADATALASATERLEPFGARFTPVNSNFRRLALVAEELQLTEVDAVLFDLGLSSVQLDSSGRGFSFRFDEPIDMRFDPTNGEPSAADLLNSEEESELARIFWEYGEEPRSRRLAASVVRRREQAPIRTTADFVEAATEALGPRRGRTHPATRAFQALRIAVNDELGALEDGLRASVDLLKPGGHLAVISFHSLEDRIVKWRLREWAESTEDRPASLKLVNRKAIAPSEEELARNPRARSAKLRVAQKLTAAPLTSPGRS